MKKLLKISALVPLFIILAYVRLISQSPTILPFGPITVNALFKKNVTIEGNLTVEGTTSIDGFSITDTDASNSLSLVWDEDDSADRILNFQVDGGNRTIELKEDLTLNESFTVGDGYNVTITALGQANTFTMNETFTIGNGHAGTLTFSAASKVLTVATTNTLDQSVASGASPTFGTPIVTGLISSGTALDINSAVIQDINLWDTIASGNPSLNIYGWNTAGGDRESAELTMDDTNDEFIIQVPNSANNEGVTVSLQETNQRFRIRQNSDYISMYHDGSNAYYYTNDGQHIFDTGESAANAMLGLTDSDGSNVVYISAPALTGDWTLTLQTAAHARSGVPIVDSSGVSTWSDDDAGVCFMMVESDTACTIVNGTVAFTVPATMNGWELVTAIASVTDKGITNTMDIQVRKRSGGADGDMLSTLITMGDEFFVADGVVKNDNTEDVATGDQVYIDVDAIHTGTAANGLSVTLVFRRK